MSNKNDPLNIVSGRIALLGGTFNPIHIGHLRAAIEVSEALDLLRVDLMPSANPPHKSRAGILPFDMRVELLQASIKGEAKLGICDLESRLPSPSYTWNTAIEWEREHGVRPLFILGDIDFSQLQTWRNGCDLPQVTDMIVMPRSGSDTIFRKTIEKYWNESKIDFLDKEKGIMMAKIKDGICIFLPVPVLRISATQIRQKWIEGKSVQFLVPQGVFDLLKNKDAEVAMHWLQ